MNKLTKWILLRLFATIVIGCTGCNKTLDQSSTEVASETLQWTTISDTRSALIGMYGLFRAALCDNNAHWMYGEMRLGDFKAFNRTDLNLINQNKLNAGFALLENLADWRRFYAVINAAAVFIQHAPQVKSKDIRYSDLTMQYDIAQARLLRAFAYFYMVRIWGDVPLITEAYDNGSFPARPRTDAKAVLSYAENEILAVVSQLPYSYGTSSQTYYDKTSGTWNGVLFNRIAAYAILAHIAAWQGNYINTEAYSRLVMDNYTQSGITYTSITNLVASAGLFSNHSASQMVAFSAIDANSESSQSGHIESLTLASPLVVRQNPDIFVPKDSITAIFNDLKDLRFGLDTLTNIYRTSYFTNFGGEIPIFSKIKVIRDGITDPTYSVFGSALIFSRLEEITLLRAEALAILNRKAEAVQYLNVIRVARGLPLYNDLNPENIVDAVFSERRRELMGEGWRWYDQIRQQRVRQTNPVIVGLINQNGIYWPLAAKNLSENTLLVQNTYWK